MKRRDSLKALALGAMSTSLLVEACKSTDKKAAADATPASTIDRTKEEAENEERLMKEKFFTDHELATITVLADIIIPKDEVSGSASDAKVPEFIEFIVKDKPEHQVPMRGGLRWVDMQCLKKHNKAFKDCSSQEQLALVDAIAYPAKATKEMKPGATFFNLMRNLTATGFYTSKIGVEDIGYQGNVANRWDGVPEDVQKQYSVAYTEKELKECVKYDEK